MRRAPELQPLSRDHHQALAVALVLRRATPDTAAEAARRFLEFFAAHGHLHFRAEEEVLLPAFAAHADADRPEVVRMLLDHIEIRRAATALEAGDAEAGEAAALRALGERLDAHVRLEERELFGIVERALPPGALAALGEALERAERGG